MQRIVVRIVSGSFVNLLSQMYNRFFVKKALGGKGWSCQLGLGLKSVCILCLKIFTVYKISLFVASEVILRKILLM